MDTAVEQLHDFFVASAGVAGALIGLLFVVMSVAGERMREHGAGGVHRLRANGALTVFTNALVVSLFALIPYGGAGGAALSVAAVGIGSVIASVSVAARTQTLRLRHLRSLLFLGSMLALFVIQLVAGIRLQAHPHESGPSDTLATLVVASFVIGIGLAWDLVGGPQIGLRQELIRRLQREDDEPT